MLYNDEQLDHNLRNFLNINGGFLRKMPPNVSVKVKIHCYIIKTSIFNPIHFMGKFEPYLFLECGSTQINEKFKNDSIETFVGRCFEFEAKFPNESQLSISIKNWNFLEGTELIGQTTIDLEDRFYSDCYATCGLPKKFEPYGYNMWRDTFTPKQILAKMCKKFGFQTPKYIGSNQKVILYIYDLSGSMIHKSTDKQNDEDSDSSWKSISESDSDLEKQIESQDDTLSNFSFKDELSNKESQRKIYEEQLALDALHNWEKYTSVRRKFL